MCGIVGYIGQRKTTEVLLKGLKRLEYRGYDSAGVALFTQKGLEIRKSEGKLSNVENLLKSSEVQNVIFGIGHTRWATHGKPTTQNAHPHQAGHVVIVHNGIIENYQEIKNELLQQGYNPISETDSELFGFMVLHEMKQGKSLKEAVSGSFKRIMGANSVVVASEKESGTLIGVRNGLPLVAGYDPKGKGVILASDPQPVLEYTSDVYFLENGDMVVAKGETLEFFDFNTLKFLKREPMHLDWTPETMDKQGYAHYMLKEIFEQPRVVVDTLNAILDRKKAEPFVFAAQPAAEILKKAQSIVLVAAGTSYHSALLGKYWIERWARVPVQVELSSEYRYRDPVLDKGAVVVGMSQSGETADTLAVIQSMKKRGIATLGICNVRGSTIAREADGTFFTSAGPEIGVAATKTFLAQLTVLLLWAGFLAVEKLHSGVKGETYESLKLMYDQFIKIPQVLGHVLQQDGEWVQNIKSIAKRVSKHRGFFFIGRGYSFPLALEGALKLKEIAYIHAEGYAAGELKHGPIAMIDNEMVLVAICPKDTWHEKTLSNLHEVKARGATILGIGSPQDTKLTNECDSFIPIPTFKGQTLELDESLAPFVVSPILQLLSYEIALLRETDVDQPRNLAKSVTVE